MSESGKKDPLQLQGQYTLQKVEKMMDMAYDTIPHWPSVFRYSRGERILDLLSAMEELCVAAYLRYHKKTTLQELDIKNHQLQLAMRDAAMKSYKDKAGRRRQLIKPGGYEVWADLMDQTGRLIGGWIKAVNERDKNGK